MSPICYLQYSLYIIRFDINYQTFYIFLYSSDYIFILNICPLFQNTCSYI
nr:MAG TPA: hypothetical protein [Caudoviricetes sp.]